MQYSLSLESLGKSWEILIEDDDLVDLLLETRKLGSKGKDTDLFYFVNTETENENDLKAEHINQYIQDATGESYTAKDFRTWAATWKCAYRLAFIDKDEKGSTLENFIKELPEPANENLQNLVNDDGRIESQIRILRGIRQCLLLSTRLPRI